MSEKKMVSRNVAVALGIICIVLAACLAGTGVLMNAKITNLQNQVNDLNNTLSLAKSTVWVNNQTISQPQDSWSNWTFRADYAGYVLVQVYNSTILNPLAEVVYNYRARVVGLPGFEPGSRAPEAHSLDQTSRQPQSFTMRFSDQKISVP